MRHDKLFNVLLTTGVSNIIYNIVSTVPYITCIGRTVALWLRHYATSRKVVGSRPDEVMNFFNLLNSFGRTRPWDLLSL
jgi:hypothetical protein